MGKMKIGRQSNAFERTSSLFTLTSPEYRKCIDDLLTNLGLSVDEINCLEIKMWLFVIYVVQGWEWMQIQTVQHHLLN